MRVAVVIPVGSYDGLVEPQVRAVLAQDLAPVAVVLSVNSPALEVVDAVAEMVRRIDDARVEVVSSADVRSAAHARNVGTRAAAAHAPLVAFCDADDLVEAGWLRALVDALGDHAAVGGRLVDEYPDERMRNWRPAATPDTNPSFLGVPYIVTANMVVRVDAFEAVGGFDTSLVRCEDIAISWALLRSGRTLGYAAGAVVRYRHRPGVWPLLRQHELYGRGMSQVLARYGVPSGDTWKAPGGAAMLRPNGQKTEGGRSLVGTMRRGAIAVGRVHGLVREKVGR